MAKEKPEKEKSHSSSSKSEADSAAVKGGKHSHMNDPHPPKHSSEELDPNDPAAAARKGGQHSHTGSGERMSQHREGEHRK